MHWKAVEQCFTVVLFVFQYHQVCHLKTPLYLKKMLITRVLGCTFGLGFLEL